jgi:hypothetical protein
MKSTNRKPKSGTKKQRRRQKNMKSRREKKRDENTVRINQRKGKGKQMGNENELRSTRRLQVSSVRQDGIHCESWPKILAMNWDWDWAETSTE